MSAWSRSETCLVRDRVAHFVAEYVADRCGQVDGIVDLWADSGHLLSRVAALTGARRPVGVCATAAVADRLGPSDARVDWQVADPAGPLPHMAGTVDVVLGMPNWHWAPRRIERDDTTGRRVMLTDDPANVAIIEASAGLSDAGLGFFLVGPGLLMRPGNGTVMPNFGRFGLHVDGIVELPRGAIAPDHGAAQVLLVLSRTERPDQVVGRLPDDPAGMASMQVPRRRTA